VVSVPAGVRLAARTVNGIPLRVDPVGRHVFTPIYDEGAAACLRTHLREGMEAWNVGANIGVYALQLAHLVGAAGRVVAFEPNPAAREVLARFGVALSVLGVERLLAATVAMAVLEGRVDPRPIPLGRTVELCERLFEGTAQTPRLRPSAAERARAVLEPVVAAEARQELRRLVDSTLERLVGELATPYLQEGRLDPTLSVVLPMEGTPSP
jgi:hypothetical protein